MAHPRGIATVAHVLALTVLASTAAAGIVRDVHQIATAPPGGVLGSVTHWEPSVAIDPLSSSHLVAVYQQDRWTEEGADGYPTRRTIGFATSHDGGQRWTSGSLPALTLVTGGPFERATDPVVTFGPDAAVYALTLGWDSVRGCRSAMVVQRSDDGGETFGGPILVQDERACGVLGAFRNDKGWIAADTGAASPRRGRIYVAWTREDPGTGSAPVVLRFSDDRAATWSDLVTVSGTAPLAGGFGAMPLVLPNGDLTVVYDDFPLALGMSRFVAQTSHDGGLGFDAPVVIADDRSREVPGVRTKGIDVTFPAAAVDPVRGALYVAWQDGRRRADDRNDVVVSRSIDGGAHWEPPRLVNDDAGTVRNHFTPAVAAYDGVVTVTYATRDGDAPWVQTRASVSTDGGTTFGKPHRVGPRGDLRFAMVATLGPPLLTLGDYTGLAADAAGAHAVWMRPARGPHQTPWTARIGSRRPVRGQP